MHAGREENRAGHEGWEGCVGGAEKSTFCLTGPGLVMFGRNSVSGGGDGRGLVGAIWQH